MLHTHLNQSQENEPISTINLDLSISTPINADQLAIYLEGYDSTHHAFLIHGFKFGFKIPYQGPRQFRLSKNLSSIRENEHILRGKLAQEIKAGHFAGPFQTPPLITFQSSPLGLVPKKKPGDFRLIHHLSHPEGGSINDNIPQEMCSVHYQTLDHAISAIKHIGRGALLAKTDLENAYKQVPVHPRDFELLGFQFDGEFYFDKTLPFGLSYSCNLFERFSSALQWILETKFSVSHCVHILDDFLFIGRPNSQECYDALASFHVLAKEINLPVKAEKTVLPTTTLTFMGLELDSLKFEIRLPEDKLQNLRETIEQFTRKRTATLRELQSLIGLLNFACTVVPPGRAFLRRIIDLTKGIQKPHHYRNLDKEARADLKAWAIFLQNFNGRAIFHSGRALTSHSLHLFTDASNLGFGCVFANKWFYGPFEEQWLNFHISVREFFPIILAVEMWGPLFTHTSIVLHSDNIAVVHVINKNTSRDPLLMKLMRRLMVASLKHNIYFHAEHIPGLHNTAADLLSRLQIDRFKALFPSMEKEPTEIPRNLLHL